MGGNTSKDYEHRSRSRPNSGSYYEKRRTSKRLKMQAEGGGHSGHDDRFTVTYDEHPIDLKNLDKELWSSQGDLKRNSETNELEVLQFMEPISSSKHPSDAYGNDNSKANNEEIESQAVISEKIKIYQNNTEFHHKEIECKEHDGHLSSNANEIYRNALQNRFEFLPQSRDAINTEFLHHRVTLQSLRSKPTDHHDHEQSQSKLNASEAYRAQVTEDPTTVHLSYENYVPRLSIKDIPKVKLEDYGVLMKDTEESGDTGEGDGFLANNPTMASDIPNCYFSRRDGSYVPQGNTSPSLVNVTSFQLVTGYNEGFLRNLEETTNPTTVNGIPNIFPIRESSVCVRDPYSEQEIGKTDEERLAESEKAIISNIITLSTSEKRSVTHNHSEVVFKSEKDPAVVLKNNTWSTTQRDLGCKIRSNEKTQISSERGKSRCPSTSTCRKSNFRLFHNAQLQVLRQYAESESKTSHDKNKDQQLGKDKVMSVSLDVKKRSRQLKTFPDDARIASCRQKKELQFKSTKRASKYKQKSIKKISCDNMSPSTFSNRDSQRNQKYERAKSGAIFNHRSGGSNNTSKSDYSIDSIKSEVNMICHSFEMSSKAICENFRQFCSKKVRSSETSEPQISLIKLRKLL